MLKKLLYFAFAAVLSMGQFMNANSDSICNHFRRREGYITEISENHLGVSFSAIDWDGDGDVDILAPDKNGKVVLYENENGMFIREKNPIARIPVTEYMGSAISAVDWDGDGDIDILAAEREGEIIFYENSSVGFIRRQTIAKVPATIYRGYAFSARDFNNDGKIDILATEGNGWVFLYENKNGRFVKKDDVVVKVPASFGYGSAISAVDWDCDGDIDILAMDKKGKIVLYENIK